MFHYKKTQLGGGLCKKPKFWILTIAIIIFSIEFFRNFMGNVIPWAFIFSLGWIELVLQFTVYVLLCHFFIKAASKLVGVDRVNKWNRILYAVTIFSYIALAGDGIEMIIVRFIRTDHSIYGCKTPMYWTSDVIMLIVLSFFIYAAWQISAVIQHEIDYERTESEESGDEFNENSLKVCIEKARKTSIKNMWLICLTLLFTTVFDTVYTLCTYFLASEYCTP